MAFFLKESPILTGSTAPAISLPKCLAFTLISLCVPNLPPSDLYFVCSFTAKNKHVGTKLSNPV